MSRPAVSVVMPFAGTAAEAGVALAALARLRTGPEDELILADNSGTAVADGVVRVVEATGERSPSHARNAGAARAARDWILFLDADCRAPASLLDGFLAEPVADDVGALAGAVAPASAAAGIAARYGAAKSFLDQDVHLGHGFMPRAVAANLLVRRSAFEAIGGFYEGVRAAEDTDFSWRLQRAGWLLESRPEARVEHAYRTSLGALRRQWRGYAAGRAWLARRYDGFSPEPAVRRAAGRVLHRKRPRPQPATPAAGAPLGLVDRGRFLALDAILGFEELAGLTLSNRPRGGGLRPDGPVQVVLVANRFPARGDPLADFALSLADARVEATARPAVVHREAAHGLTVDYREDDGAAARAGALLRLLIRHPWRCARDVLTRWRAEPGAPRLAAIAPAAIRLQRDPEARVHPLGGPAARTAAARLARLAGRHLDS